MGHEFKVKYLFWNILHVDVYSGITAADLDFAQLTPGTAYWNRGEKKKKSHFRRRSHFYGVALQNNSPLTLFSQAGCHSQGSTTGEERDWCSEKLPPTCKDVNQDTILVCSYSRSLRC